MTSVLVLALLVGTLTTSPADSLRQEREEAFRAEVRAMALDLESARGIEVGRARRIAYVAVGEAWRYGVPSALVFGVLMQETSRLDRDAVSVAGARGLMQIMPKIWLPVLSRYFGEDLFDETTNLRYGVWILAHDLHLAGGDWARALARYSGGANRYAEKVRAHVERKAVRLCPRARFEQCVVLPARRQFSRRR